jgi:hypothetical protein
MPVGYLMDLNDADILEGNIEVDEFSYYEAMQRAINEGTAWRLQGSYGRSMMAAIEAGRCMLGTQSCEDAYGSRIPSRSDVQPDTKGSRNFVAQCHGEEWVRRMEAVDAD